MGSRLRTRRWQRALPETAPGETGSAASRSAFETLVGWFGGFLPLIAASLLAATGNLYAGLIYPITVALITVVVGGLFLRESRHVKIWDEVGGETAPAVGQSAPPEAVVQGGGLAG